MEKNIWAVSFGLSVSFVLFAGVAGGRVYASELTARAEVRATASAFPDHEGVFKQDTSPPVPLSLNSVSKNGGIANAYANYGRLRLFGSGLQKFKVGEFDNQANFVSFGAWQDSVTVNAAGMAGKSGFVRGVLHISGPRLNSTYTKNAFTPFDAAWSLQVTTGAGTASNYYWSFSDTFPNEVIGLNTDGPRLDQQIVTAQQGFTFGHPFPIEAFLTLSGGMRIQGARASSTFALGSATDPYTVTWKKLQIYDDQNKLILNYRSVSDSGFDYKPPVPVISSSRTALGKVGEPFLYTIRASRSPTQFGATGLPRGLSINATTGKISGTPREAGKFEITAKAVNDEGPGFKLLKFTVEP